MLASTLQGQPADAERLAQRLLDPLGRAGHGVLGLDVGQQHRELVAAQAGHLVALAQDGAQALAHPLDHQVAVEVAEGVVDLLEPVQVHQQHRHLAAAGAVGQGLLGQGVEHLAVGQPGQRVRHPGAVRVLAPRPGTDPAGHAPTGGDQRQQQAHDQQAGHLTLPARGGALERGHRGVGVQDADRRGGGGAAQRHVGADRGRALGVLALCRGVAGHGHAEVRGGGQLAGALAGDAGVGDAAAGVRPGARPGPRSRRPRGPGAGVHPRALRARGVALGHGAGQGGLAHRAAHDLGLALGGALDLGVPTAGAPDHDRQGHHHQGGDQQSDLDRDRRKAQA